ncbi:minor capsid protein [Ammoniphilus oxalaticus]|uniref:minor capsid protein n=1 Tax=Ammoniphilus oxalaticus TaxID=66863 RepID=UPI0014737FF1|nr:minor capsid protein [Ammoniphilus oxalaticus]
MQQIEVFYAKYAVENQVPIELARKYLTAKEVQAFKETDLERFRELSLSDNPRYKLLLNEISYRTRISRLEGLNAQIEMRMIELYGGLNSLQQHTYSGLTEVYQSTYYHTMFDLAKQGVVSGAIDVLTDRTMKEILSYNWSGLEFSERIWGHQEQTLAAIRKELERSFATGRSIQRTTKAIMEVTDVSRSRAETLIRTETNFFHTNAAQQAYVEAGIDQYEILATLDRRTSAICRGQDGQVYDEKDYEPGKTAPPFHPNCRTTTIPYFDEAEYMEGERRQSANGLIQSMTYEEWYDKYVK